MSKIIKASSSDLREVMDLLNEVNLPIEGVSDHFQNFFIVRGENQVVGCAGIEIYEDSGLIRSVAVHPSFQDRGLGHELVDKIHSYSKEQGLKKIFLLTETAEKFFSKFEYEPITRENADSRVKQSIEFTSACPVSATCMVKYLVK